MTFSCLKRASLLAGVSASMLTTLLTGCASQPRSLYYWGDYQSEVYQYFKPTDASPEQQLLDLQKTVEKARSAGQALPPGFEAHMGLLYLQTGHEDQALQAFRQEEHDYPESQQYIEYLLSKKTGEKTAGGTP